MDILENPIETQTSEVLSDTAEGVKGIGSELFLRLKNIYEGNKPLVMVGGAIILIWYLKY